MCLSTCESFPVSVVCYHVFAFMFRIVFWLLLWFTFVFSHWCFAIMFCIYVLLLCSALVFCLCVLHLCCTCVFCKTVLCLCSAFVFYICFSCICVFVLCFVFVFAFCICICVCVLHLHLCFAFKICLYLRFVLPTQPHSACVLRARVHALSVWPCVFFLFSFLSFLFRAKPDHTRTNACTTQCVRVRAFRVCVCVCECACV